MKAVFAVGCLLAFASIALAVNLPSDGSCVTFASTDNFVTVPVIGLSQDHSKQCAYVRTQAGMDYTYNIDLTGYGAIRDDFDVEVLVWNKNRLRPVSYALVLFVEYNGNWAYAVPTVDATTGAITSAAVVYSDTGFTPTNTYTVLDNTIDRGGPYPDAYMPALPNLRSATLIAIANTQGQIASIVVQDGGAGYPTNTNFFDLNYFSNGPQVQIQVAPIDQSPYQTSYGLNSVGTFHDPSCPSDPGQPLFQWDCVQYGMSQWISSGDFDCASLQLEFTTKWPMDLGITVRLVANNANSHPHAKPGVPLVMQGVPYDTAEPITVDVAPGTLSMPHAEFRVTFDTPDGGNWLCSNTTGNNQWDCSLPFGKMSSWQTDKFTRVDYPLAPLVDISPATRGLQVSSVAVSNGGTGYTSPVTVSVSTPAPTVTANTVRVFKFGTGYILADGVTTVVPRIIHNLPVGPSPTATVDASGKLTGITTTPYTFAAYNPAAQYYIQIKPWYQVIGLQLQNAGFNYDVTNPPVLVIAAPNAVGGVRATGTINLGPSDTSDGIAGVHLSNPTTNWGYDSAPPSVLVGYRVLTVAVGSGGSSYTTAPSITPNCFDYSGQFAASLTLAGGVITGISVTNGGAFADSCLPSFSISGGAGGSGFTVGAITRTPGQNAVVVAAIRPIEASGTYAEWVIVGYNPYSRGATVVGTMGTPAGGTACSPTSASGSLASVTVIDAGAGYYTTPTASVSGFPGTGAAVTIGSVVASTDAMAHATVDSNGLITSVVLDNAGAGYSSAPVVTFRTVGRIGRARVTNPGWGYESAPDVMLSAGSPTTGGRPAAFSAVFNPADGSVSGINVVDPGHGYSAGSVFSLDIIPINSIKSITVPACFGGSGYTVGPAVRLVGAGWGFEGTAIISNGVVTGVTITSAGKYYSGPVSVAFVGGTYTTQADGTRAVVVVSDAALTNAVNNLGSGYAVATAEVFVENGQYATAVAAVDGSGAVSSIRVIKAGPVYTENDITSGVQLSSFHNNFFGNGVYGGRFLNNNQDYPINRLVLDASGQLLDVDVTGTERYQLRNPHFEYNVFGLQQGQMSNMFNFINNDGYVFTPRLGANEADQLVNFVEGYNGDFNSWYIQTRMQLVAQYGVTQKIFTYLDPDMDGSPNARPQINFDFIGGDSNYFRSNPAQSIWTSINAAGLLSTTVTFDVIDYPDITNTKVSSAVMYDSRFNRPVRFAVKPTGPWARVWFEVTVTSGNSDTLAVRAFDGSGFSANLNDVDSQMHGVGSFSSYNPQELFATGPSSSSGFAVEISFKGCSGNAVGDTVSFDITAHVVGPDDASMGGECLSQLDCIATSAHGPAPKSTRVQFSANQDPSRFTHCVTQFNGTARCAECFSDCDCAGGQYCFRDKGLCQDNNGNWYVCDEQAYQMFGTCQWKDPQDKIFGRPCYSNMYASISMNNTEDQLVGVCGEVRYFNSSYVDGSGKNYTGVARGSNGQPNWDSLWDGVCVNNVCYECYEADSGNFLDLNGNGVGNCNNHFICTDGFYSRRSGNSLQGALTQDNDQKTRDAVRTSAGVGGASLFFIIVITILLGVGVVCMFRKAGGGTSKTAPAPAVQMSSVP